MQYPFWQQQQWGQYPDNRPGQGQWGAGGWDDDWDDDDDPRNPHRGRRRRRRRRRDHRPFPPGKFFGKPYGKFPHHKHQFGKPHGKWFY